jgi:hypothetical protein
VDGWALRVTPRRHADGTRRRLAVWPPHMFAPRLSGIYHLACPASPPHYMYNPIKTIKTSVMGTLNMLGRRHQPQAGGERLQKRGRSLPEGGAAAVRLWGQQASTLPPGEARVVQLACGAVQRTRCKAGP